jgi:tetratricopeptide (TPR) repeat protein
MLFLLLNPLSSLAQGNAKRFNEANQLFQQKRYDEVLSYLQAGKKFFKTESPEITFLSAASYYYKNKLDEAEIEFVSLLKNKNSLQIEALLFLGQIRFHRQDFTTASSYLKSYLKAISPSHPNRNEVRNIIRHCATGLAIQYRNP